jgi:arginyl-tRNA synthetase
MESDLAAVDLDTLESLYKKITAEVKENAALRMEIIEATRNLQQAPKDALTVWQHARAITLNTAQGLYDRLGVLLEPEDVRGESFYSDRYDAMVAGLRAAGKAVETDGAVGIFPPGFVNKEGEPRPFIIQSRDGTYQYPTFDLAALRYRVQTLHAQRVIYTHDSRQAEHFEMLFAVAKLLKWTDGASRDAHVQISSEPGRVAPVFDEFSRVVVPAAADRTSGPTGPARPGSDNPPRTLAIELDYAPFGTMLGEDGKPFKTRSGDTVKLKDLLDEAEERALAVVVEKNAERPPEHQIPPDKLPAIAHAVGIGAVKYSDLSKDRTSDYVFSWEKMLSFDGNTAPYLQYAYARIASIFRKAAGSGSLTPGQTPTLESPYEQSLAKHVLRMQDIIALVSRELKPHYLCTYLYELAGKFSSFYENCDVLKSEEPTRSSRLMLIDITRRTLGLGLDLLGIEHPEQM